MPEYKVIETSVVTDEVIEGIINDYVSKGWNFDEIKFAMREASKRPAMAFLIFVRESSTEVGGND